MRNPYGGDIIDVWMVAQHILGLLGIDVDPARDDHVAFPVRQIKPVIGVDIAHVADRGPTLAGPRLSRLGVVTTIFERHEAGGEEHLPNLSGRRSEERRVGTEWVSTCRTRGSPSH